MSDFDWTAYILFKQLTAIKSELDKIDLGSVQPTTRGTTLRVESATGPMLAFNQLLRKAKQVLAGREDFSQTIAFLEEYDAEDEIRLSEVSELRTSVDILVETLDAFIHATFPQKEKQKIGFL